MHLKRTGGTPDGLDVDPIVGALSRADSNIRRVIFIRSCQLDLLPYYLSMLQPDVEIEDYIVNGVSEMPATTKASQSEYAFQIIQVPLSAVVPLPIWLTLDTTDDLACKNFFDDCAARLRLFVELRLKWACEFSIPAFVLNFLVPQQNYMGRAQPRYALQNPVYFIEKLNEELSRIIDGCASAYLLDAEGASRALGKRYLQDDSIHNTLHGGLISDYGHIEDEDRLHPVPWISAQFDLHPIALVETIWREAVAIYRAIRQIDSVKIVVVDLDDTLWRGIPAEGAAEEIDRIGGWPLGMLEALVYLRRRGIVLGIISKNDYEKTSANWQKIYGSYISWDIFTFKEIGWNSKADGMEAILRKANLLPTNALFIDDNPVERAAMQSAFPGVRVLGENQYIVRSVLLHSSETQVAHITREASRRAEMIAAQVEREESRTKLTKKEFLESLNVQIQRVDVASVENEYYPRCFELINKTNQFNTTGRRWSQSEMHTLLRNGGVLHAFRVSDKFTDYGIVAIAVAQGNIIEQFVMSCRVIGLEVESRALRSVFAQMSAPISAKLIDTGANGLVTHLWANLGFKKETENCWTLTQAA